MAWIVMMFRDVAPASAMSLLTITHKGMILFVGALCLHSARTATVQLVVGTPVGVARLAAELA